MSRLVAPERSTPYLALDLPTVQSNIQVVAELCAAAGLALRPHFKAHKLAEVAEMQLRAGAVGISTATLAEAAALVDAGLRRGLLVTSEIVGRERLTLLDRLLASGAEIIACVESEEGIQDLLAPRIERPIGVLVDVDVGTNRTGARADEVARLAARIASEPRLRFLGLQTYHGHPSRTVSASERRSQVLAGWDVARKAIATLEREGLRPSIVSAGNTSTVEFDLEAGVITELQLGGYVVGDEDYQRLERPEEIQLPGGRRIPNPFRRLGQALRVVASVVSRRGPSEVIVDAGLKAFSTDRPQVPEAEGIPGATYAFDGDEFGRLALQQGEAPPRGAPVVFRIQHCDPTVNLYSQVEVFDAGGWMGTWDVLARHPQARLPPQPPGLSPTTQALHAGYRPDPTGNITARGVPITPTVAYMLRDFEHGVRLLSLQEEGHTYSRISNPTVSVLEDRMAALEGGGRAVAFASGAAATTAVFLGLCRQGDNIVCTETMYGGTADLLKHTLGHLGITARFFPVDDLASLEEAIDGRTRAIFAESIGNPKLDIPEFTTLREIARARGVPLVIDNTVLTPALLRVRDVGGDIALYSASKFLVGHGTAIGGVVVDLGTYDWATSPNPVFRDVDPSYGFAFGQRFGREAFAARLRASVLRNTGACLGSFEAWCILQGIETLEMRMQRHSANALAVARFLQDHPRIESVNYTALPGHPYYRRCQRYMGGRASGLLFFEVRGGLEAARRVLERCRLISHVTQFGDVKSCIQHPASTSHSQVPEEQKGRAGLSPHMLRLSVGLESVHDIVADLAQALEG